MLVQGVTGDAKLPDASASVGRRAIVHGLQPAVKNKLSTLVISKSQKRSSDVTPQATCKGLFSQDRYVQEDPRGISFCCPL